MELDEMKNLWQQYDKALQQNKILNEQLVQMMLKDKSKNTIRNILNFEYTGLIVCSILILVFALQFTTIFGNTLMMAAYFISLLFIIASLVLFYYKHKMLTSLNFSSSKVSDTARTLERFRLLVSKERLWTFICSPVIIAALLIVFTKWVRNIDIMDMPDVFLPRIIIGSVALLISLAVLYRLLYFNNIKAIKQNLEEIEQFRS